MKQQGGVHNKVNYSKEFGYIGLKEGMMSRHRWIFISTNSKSAPIYALHDNVHTT